MDLTISIVNWNGGEEILKFLDSIFRYTRDIDFEVIAVDNASSDGSVEKIRAKFPQGKIIQQGYNSGYSRAHNAGWKAGVGKYVAFMNLDMELRENSFKILVNFLDAHKDVDVVTPGLVYPDGSIQPNIKRNPALWEQIIILLKLHFWLRRAVSNYLFRDFDYTKEAEVEQIMGACVVARRQIVEKIGGWGEEYFPILWEDVDFCKKVQIAKGRIFYTPSTKIVHYESTSFQKLFSLSKQKRFNRGLLTYFRKYHPRREYMVLQFLHPVSLALAWVVQILGFKPRNQAKASR